jgi:hypothetical protein
MAELPRMSVAVAAEKTEVRQRPPGEEPSQSASEARLLEEAASL